MISCIYMRKKMWIENLSMWGDLIVGKSLLCILLINLIPWISIRTFLHLVMLFPEHVIVGSMAQDPFQGLQWILLQEREQLFPTLSCHWRWWLCCWHLHLCSNTHPIVYFLPSSLQLLLGWSMSKLPITFGKLTSSTFLHYWVLSLEYFLSASKLGSLLLWVLYPLNTWKIVFAFLKVFQVWWTTFVLFCVKLSCKFLLQCALFFKAYLQNWFWLSLTGMYLSIKNFSACDRTPHSCPWKDSWHQYIPKCFTISRGNSHTWNSSCSYWCCHLLCKHQLHCREVGFLLKKFARNFIVGGWVLLPEFLTKLLLLQAQKICQ